VLLGKKTALYGRCGTRVSWRWGSPALRGKKRGSLPVKLSPGSMDGTFPNLSGSLKWARWIPINGKREGLEEVLVCFGTMSMSGFPKGLGWTGGIKGTCAAGKGSTPYRVDDQSWSHGKKEKTSGKGTLLLSWYSFRGGGRLRVRGSYGVRGKRNTFHRREGRGLLGSFSGARSTSWGLRKSIQKKRWVKLGGTSFL